MGKTNLITFLILLLFTLSSASAYDISFFDTYDGESSSHYDDITWVNDPFLEARLSGFDSEWGVCWDEDSDGNSFSTDEFDYCYFVLDSDKSECINESGWLYTFCVSKGKPCLTTESDSVLPDRSDTLPSGSKRRQWVDAKIYLSCSGYASIMNLDAEDYFVIDAKRADCDGALIDVIGRYSSTDWISISQDLECNPTGSSYTDNYFGSNLFDDRCDNDHDDINQYSESGKIISPCRINQGSEAENACVTYADCYQDAVCDGSQQAYYPICAYDGSDDFILQNRSYRNTCGGYGYLSYYTQSTEYCSQATPLNTKICDTDHDMTEYLSGVYDACKKEIGETCSVQDDCWGDRPCNSDNRCGECYTGRGALFNQTDEDCNEAEPYCLDDEAVSYGYPEDYMCGCVYSIDNPDFCCNQSSIPSCGYPSDFCQWDSECKEAYACNVSVENSSEIGICINPLDDGFNCDRDRQCASGTCNDDGHCGECWSIGIDNSSLCTEPDKPYCTGNLSIFGVCNLDTPYVCDCCDVLGQEDCCLEIPAPYYYGGSWTWSTCTDGFDCECEYYEHNSTLNISCLDFSGTNYCVDCNSSEVCVNKYGFLTYNDCDLLSGYCICNASAENPSGCQSSGFCFGRLPGGSDCDCDAECDSGSCTLGICESEVKAFITPSTSDDDIDDDWVLWYNESIGLNSTNSSSDVGSIIYSCWKTSQSGYYYDTCYSTLVNCSVYCTNADYINNSWDTIHNFSPDRGGEYTVYLTVSDNFSSDITSRDVCFKGNGSWCGETCFDNVKNRDETDIDYGGSCGNCSNGVMDAYEIKVDYGWLCGTCNDDIKNVYVTINSTDYPISNPELDVDLGGRCGNCTNGIRDVLIGETLIDYGGVCGTCFDDIKNDYINETEPDYGGHICGYCESNSTKSDDVAWRIARQLSRSIPFDKENCETVNSTIGLFILIILGILFVGVFVILIIIIFWVLQIISGVLVFVRFLKKVKLSSDMMLDAASFYSEKNIFKKARFAWSFYKKHRKKRGG